MSRNKSAMRSSSDLLIDLESKYCPPLDTTTFLSIISDFDVLNTDELNTAQQILDSLSSAAVIEEDSGFDPSGSGGGIPAQGDEKETVRSDSGHGWSSTTDSTSLNHGMSALDLEQSPISDLTSEWSGAEERDANHDAQFEGLNAAEREALLIETFPALKPFDVQWSLKRCHGDATLAVDDLLNQMFLEESGGRQHGIDGFLQTNEPVKSKKPGAKKRKGRLTSASSAQSEHSSISAAKSSTWERASEDIEFLSSRTSMPHTQVSSIYHSHGTSIKATIAAILDAHADLMLDAQNSTVQRKAQLLARDYPTISLSRLYALVQLTAPSLTSAEEVASVLVAKAASSESKGPIQIEFRLPPPNLHDEQPTKLKPLAHNAVYVDDYKPSDSLHSSQNYKALRNNAFSQASAAYRRGKSDHLMGGAAAYYSSMGRDLDHNLKSAEAAEMDALVARQSKCDSLDLHGVDVKNAVRIAREGVTAWWARSSASATHGGFRVVTGKGTHSEGGKSKLGPAVGRMLIKEGWKVEVGSGALVVTGVAGRR